VGEALPALLAEVRACRLCEPHLPLGPRPVLSATSTARVLIAGQAPGTRVHATGVPWNDPSGDRLRDWLDLDRAAFYDAATFAIVPMGFCYPGRSGGGDAPPRPECAATWRSRVLALLPEVRLTLAIGRYAQAWHLGGRNKRSLGEAVRAWREYAPAVFPLPHPSPRNRRWLRDRPWFEAEVLPALRAAVAYSTRGVHPPSAR
jgi:uracil-DNA glycosylase